MNRWVVKISLFLNYFVFAILLNSVGTVVLQVQNTYGVSESSAAVLEAFKDLPIAITSFLVASFLVRVGYRRAMLLALGFIALVALAMPQVPTFWMAKVMFAATGVGFALVKISVFATLGLVTESRKEHASLMNFLESFFMVGVLSGYFIFSAFVDDADPSSPAWLDVYWVLATMSLAAFALLLFARIDESAAHVDEPEALVDEFTGMLELCIRPLVIVFIASAFLYVLIEQSIMSWLPTFNSRILNLAPSLSIQMASILAASTALGRFSAGILLRRFDWSRVLIVGLVAAAALVLVALPLASGNGGGVVTTWAAAPLAAFIFPLIGFLIAPVYPAINSVMLSALPPHQHGAMAGLIVVFSALGGTSGSLITGTLFEHLGGQTAFYFSLVPITLIIVTLILFKRRSDRHLEREGERRSVGEPPDRLYAELFEAVQSTRLLGDSKTFVDAVARSEPAEVVGAYRAARDRPDFDLATFVRAHFELPTTDIGAASDPAGPAIEDRIEQLWDHLTRGPDQPLKHSSLIPLPHRYVVPGGRFREVYYWDSYFTMLGLAESGRIGLIRDMVQNFAHLIDEIGFIPNGNRTYYCTRSQPPFFALMVDLLAEVSSDDSVYGKHLPHLKREYAFWMAGAEALSVDNPAHRRVVLSPGGTLNRYWDDAAIPRQESHAEDMQVAAGAAGDAARLYRDLRAGAESGWDYSSRWFEDRYSLKTIRTTRVVPVDLNSLLYNLEATIARLCGARGDAAGAAAFHARAESRKQLLQSLFFDEASGMFMDLSLPDFTVTGTLSMAAVYPLFFGIATEAQAARVAQCIHHDFLEAGGWVTSSYETGQQWDGPNGWAPLQWIAYRGLERYGHHDEARAGASRWVENTLAVYRQHGRLLEKYDVVACGLAGSGGEYQVQDGFGWTNGVLVRLMRRLRWES